ncbi:MAG TPA: TRAM domain-containing protein, partial [Thermoguttaceae bacterium]|nr:TRAM domain-containing protein [Thermoguttaceae bacterium]
REPGTASDALDGHVSEPVKQARCDALMDTQQDIAFEISAAQRGKRLDVLLDRPDDGDSYIGRTTADAPEIDCVVYVTGEKLRSGQIVPCEIVAAQEYDLIGVAVDRPT